MEVKSFDQWVGQKEKESCINCEESSVEDSTQKLFNGSQHLVLQMDSTAEFHRVSIFRTG